VIYSATLNQTNVMSNNNKFYIIQILQSDSNTDACYVFTRWGRVGVKGQNSNIGPWPRNLSINEYVSKLNEKTLRGNYRKIDLNYENEDDKKDEETKKADSD